MIISVFILKALTFSRDTDDTHNVPVPEGVGPGFQFEIGIIHFTEITSTCVLKNKKSLGERCTN